MLRLSKKADYALMAVRHLAGGASGASVSAREIAEAYAIPPELLAKMKKRSQHMDFNFPAKEGTGIPKVGLRSAGWKGRRRVCVCARVDQGALPMCGQYGRGAVAVHSRALIPVPVTCTRRCIHVGTYT